MLANERRLRVSVHRRRASVRRVRAGVRRVLAGVPRMLAGVRPMLAWFAAFYAVSIDGEMMFPGGSRMSSGR